MHYVKRNFLGGREVTSLTQANRDVLVWCETTAGLRTHGTTKEQPLTVFNETEQSRLQPLPDAPYDLAVWKVVKLHRDCYVVFDNAYYSAPHRLSRAATAGTRRHPGSAHLHHGLSVDSQP